MQALFDTLLALAEKLWPFAVVSPWERAVCVRFGKWYFARNPGTYWKWPLGIDEYVHETVVPQVVDLPEITVETKDRVPVLVSMGVQFAISDICKALVECQEFEDSLLTEVTFIATEWINDHCYTDITVESLVGGCQRKVKEAAKRWGCKVERLGVNTIAKHRVYRLVTNSGIE